VNPVFVFDHDLADFGVCEQSQELGALISDPTATLFDDFGN